MLTKKLSLLFVITLILTSSFNVPLINSIMSIRKPMLFRSQFMKISHYNPNVDDTLVIYIDSSYLAWGLDPDYARKKAFEDFGVANGISVEVIEFNGMVEGLNVLIAQKNNPQADIVIGLDSTLVSKAKKESILQPYPEVNLENISSTLVSALDPEKYLIPLDYGLIALIYDPEYISNITYPELNNLTFDDLIEPFGKMLAVQDPTLSTTGVNFLLHQIIFYEKILGKDWTEWWKNAKAFISIDKSWSDSWERVFTTKLAHMLVSYGTDPAYNAYFNYSFVNNAAIIHNNTEQYGWLQIEGIGIINGTEHLVLAKKYIDYTLSFPVQDLLATNNWMFPANNKTELPECYDYAITTENITILNTFITTDEIGENFQSWLNTWERIIYGTGLWWLWVLLSAMIILIGIAITIIIYKRRTKIDVE